LGVILVVLGIPLISLFVTLALTPAHAVSTAGQTIEVGASPRGASLQGPAQLDLFGAPIPTTLNFSGPIRPDLKWAEVTNYDQLISGLQRTQNLGDQLVQAWRQFFIEQGVAAVFLAAALSIAITLLMRLPWRIIGIAVAASVLVTGATEVVSVATLLGSASDLPQRIHSLNDIVGRRPLAYAPAPAPHTAGPVDAVVIGDSTAAGAGNTVVSQPSTTDTACRRSADSYAGDIAAANQWRVVNLACTNATISDGLFGPESINGAVVPAQLSQLSAIDNPKLIIISIGANEMHWHDLMELCLATTTCDDAASSALFQQALDQFVLNYYDLLTQLATLPSHPRVLINEYFPPIGSSISCLSHYGVTDQKVNTLLARLAMFNKALHDGATGFGFEAVQQNFAGHELCTANPYVQGPNGGAPMHPTAAGELAIALADEQALARPRPPTPSPGTNSPGPSVSPAG
jgi:lysophospholipase L1-like esterase